MPQAEASQGFLAHVLAENRIGCSSQINHGQAIDTVAELWIDVETDYSPTEFQILAQEHGHLSCLVTIDWQQR